MITINEYEASYIRGTYVENPEEADYQDLLGRMIKQTGTAILGCLECKTVHEPEAFCGNCAACLHKHSFQYRDETDYPWFECVCGHINWWD